MHSSPKIVRALARRRSNSTPPEGFEPLDAQRLSRRSIEVFPTAYTTVLSIAQGVALAALVTTSADVFADAGPEQLLPLVLQVAVTASSILVVYYMYVWFVLVFRWSPGVFDSVIPLALGAVEIILAVSIDHHRQWMLALILLMAAGAYAFGRSIWRSLPEMFSNEDARRTITRVLWILAVLCAAGALGFAGAQPWSRATDIVGLTIVVGFATIMMLFVMLTVSEYHLFALFRIYGMRRWPNRVMPSW